MKPRLFKSPNFLSLSWIGKHLKVHTAQDQHFKIQILSLWMNWEKVCPNLNFSVENKMGNSHKKIWSHFKLNINDWDIPFPQILIIYQWIGKNILHWGKWNEPNGNSAHIRMFVQKALKVYTGLPLLKYSFLLWLYNIFSSIFRTLYYIFQCFLWHFMTKLT